MSIVIRRINEELCPVVMCDECGGRIENHDDGNCVWDPNKDDSPLIFVHKNPCFVRQDRTGGKFSGFYTSTLAAFPHFIRRNLGVSVKESECSARFMSGTW